MSSFESISISSRLSQKFLNSLDDAESCSRQALEDWERACWRGDFIPMGEMDALSQTMIDYFSNAKPWKKASEDDKKNRVRFFMAALRTVANSSSATMIDKGHTMKSVFSFLLSPLSKENNKNGIPMGGFGEPSDGAFLSILFEQIAECVVNQKGGSQIPWNKMVASSMMVSLFCRNYTGVTTGGWWTIIPTNKAFGNITYNDFDGVGDVVVDEVFNPYCGGFSPFSQLPLGLSEPGVFSATLNRFLSLIVHCMKNEENTEISNPLHELKEIVFYEKNASKLSLQNQELLLQIAESAFNGKVLLNSYLDLIKRWNPMGVSALEIIEKLPKKDWDVHMQERLDHVFVNLNLFFKGLNDLELRQFDYMKGSRKMNRSLLKNVEQDRVGFNVVSPHPKGFIL